jgi:fatty acid desaturase
MTILSPESSRVAEGAGEIQPHQTAKGANSKRDDRRKVATVSWYGRLLIIATLLVAAGWELFQWVLMIITQD